MHFYIEDQFDWKPFYRSFRHHYVRSDVAQKLVEAKVTGLELVHIELEIKVPQKSGERWDYYAMKPLSVVDTLFPEEDWKLDCEICGRISQRSFGHCNRPVEMLWDSWDGSDVAHPRQFPTFLLFSRRMVDLFRANNWHHDIQEAGRGRGHWDNVHFGCDKFPGVGTRNIDNDTWYEDTLAALKEKFPDIQHELDSPPALGLPVPIPAFITPLPEEKARKQEAPKPSIPKLIEEKIFDGVYLDQDARQLFVIADCPPLGHMRIGVETQSIRFSFSAGEPNEQGLYQPSFEAELVPKAAKKTLRSLGELWLRWETLWPILFAEFLKLREECGQGGDVTSENAEIGLCPPGENSESDCEDWSIFLDLEGDTLGYNTEFRLDGTITDSYPG